MGCTRIRKTPGWLTSLWLSLMVLCLCAPTTAQTVGNTAAPQPDPAVEVLPDSSNFVKASLLTVSPTSDIYSVFGHTAIHMECPAYHLDYVFTFESDPSVSGFITFFAGKAKAQFVAVPTSTFLSDMKKEGRGVTEHLLNFTPPNSLHEQQQLWRLLDEDMVAGAHRNFNLLLDNCVSVTVRKLHDCCIGEDLQWAPWQGPMLLNNGDLVRYNARRSAWAEFLFVSFLGTGYSDYYNQESRLCPEILADELRRALFVNNETGERRPVIVDKGRELLPEAASLSPCVVSPAVLFGSLLLIVVLLTLAEWLLRWHRVAKWMDVALFVMQTTTGILLVYITFVSEIFGFLWNWYLIPMNPLPLILWLCLRKHEHFGRIYLLYTLVLAAFIIATPLIPQLDYAHQLITAILAVRCLSHYMKYKSNNEKNTNR